MREPFDYAIVRVVPRVERGECLNAGVIVSCPRLEYLGAKLALDTARLRALWPTIEVGEIERALASIPLIAAGDPRGGPIAAMPRSERFHWLVAPRSAVIQTSPVHTGICTAPAEVLDQLLARLVATPPAPAHLDLVTLVVDDYDRAIAFFVDVLQFALVEDTASMTNDGRPKRWVVVRPPGGGTGLLLAQADGDTQRAAIGNQTAGRVGFFLRVDDFEAALRRLEAASVPIITPPRDEPYGRVAVFVDLAGNRWDLLGPRPR